MECWVSQHSAWALAFARSLAAFRQLSVHYSHTALRQHSITPSLQSERWLMAPEDKPVVDSPGLIVLQRRQIGQGR